MPGISNHDMWAGSEEDRGDYLELHDHPRFQRWFWKLQRVAWTALFVGVVAALAGLTGSGGPFSAAYSEAIGSSVSYPAIMRRSRPETIHIRSLMTEIRLDRRFVATFEIDAISPLPVMQTSLNGGLVLAFAQPGPVHIALSVTPKTVLRQSFSVVIGPQSHDLATVILP